MKPSFFGQPTRLLLALALPLIFPFMANAVVWHVDHSAIGNNSGTTWVNAFTLLQSALTAAQPGDEIWVADGTYTPTATYFSNTDRHKTFFINKNIKIYGGFNGGEASPGARPSPLAITTLSGELGAPGSTDNAYHVVWMEDLSPDALLDGFVISGGYADGASFLGDAGGGIFNYGGQFGHISNPTVSNCEISGNAAEIGGGMYNLGYDNGEASPTLTNCRFLNNTALFSGGGLLNDATFNGTSSPVLLNCVFSANSASNYAGGGMMSLCGGNNGVASPSLTNCVFSGNSTTNQGGAMYSSAINGGVSAPTLVNCLFSGNTADKGAGMYNAVASPSVTGCVFSGNSAISHGGAMYSGTVNGGASSPTLTNCLFSGNAADSGAGMYSASENGPCTLVLTNCSFSGHKSTMAAGGTVRNASGAVATLKNCVLWGDDTEIQNVFGSTSFVTYSIVQGGHAGAGNLNQNPLFVSQPDFNTAPTTAGDLHLQAASPAKNSGTAAGAPADDLEGNPRPAGPGFDMGCYEFQTSCTGPSIACPASIAKNTDLNQCSAVTTYAAPTASDDCYSVTKALVTGLPSGSAFPKGSTTVTWKATNSQGATATCAFSVAVTDNQAPSIACPNNLTRPTDPNVCFAVVTYNQPAAADNCQPAPSLTLTSGGNTASGSGFGKGTTVVTWKATDGAGLTKTCSFKIIVNDTQAPAISCPSNLTKSTDPDQCSAVTTYAQPTASDNCPDVTVLLHSGLASGVAFPKGISTVVWKATDAAGLTKTCSFKVTVNDTQAPSISCPADQSKSTDPNLCSAVVTYDLPTVSDNCPGVMAVRISGLPSGSAFPKGTNTVVWKATDGQALTKTCSFKITVHDAQGPAIVCSANIAVTAPSGQCSAVVTYANPTATDNCAVASCYLLSGLASGSVFPQGVTMNTWKASDDAGATATCAFSITVSCGMGASSSSVPRSRDEVRSAESATDLTTFQKLSNLDLSLAPNPATTSVSIQVKTADNQSATLRVFDALGRMVLQQPLATGPSESQIDLNDGRFESGLYMVSVQSGEQMVTKRLVVAK